jgi:GNAT superfamily N-acetyltransferase
VHVLWVDGSPAGYAELDLRQPPDIELAYFGLMPEYFGRGLGKLFLSWTIDEAFRRNTPRFWVHTCTLDHPAALNAYRRVGFTAYKRAVERFPDPRLLSILPSDCAPQVPLVGTLPSAAPSPTS